MNTAKPTKVIVHARDEDELKTLKGQFDFPTAGLVIDQTVFGLSPETQAELILASRLGTPIYTTGLPVDIAAKLGEGIVQVRAWDKTRSDGTRSSGCTAPTRYAILNIQDSEAYKRLAENPDFQAALGKTAVEPVEV